jgi:hypothetical protein
LSQYRTVKFPHDKVFHLAISKESQEIHSHGTVVSARPSRAGCQSVAAQGREIPKPVTIASLT